MLFVCSSNLDRSPCAESLFKDNVKYEAKSCGILPHAETVISKEAIKWANIIICMEDKHKFYLIEKFPLTLEKEIIVLNVSSRYLRNDPALLRILLNKLKQKGILA